MAAPTTDIKWGNTVGDYGRIGIYRKITNTTNTQVTVNVQVWFWSKYSIDDKSNSYYYNNLASSGSATTKIGPLSIKTTVETGAGWSTSNQFKLGESTYTYDRGTSVATRYLYAKLVNIDRVGGTMYADATIDIPKLTSHTVSYNANGTDVKNIPSSQTKYYGKNITLSSVKPTRTGYSFQGWATSANGSVVYSETKGMTYTTNTTTNVTLYAVWKANTYPVKYDANGGNLGNVSISQTKTYGVTLKLDADKPTRTNYKFLGWATSATATKATYSAGGNYTSNAAVTLYAVWELAYIKPSVNIIALTRESTKVTISFDWKCTTNYSPTDITFSWNSKNDSGSVTFVEELENSGAAFDTLTLDTTGSGSCTLTHEFDVNISYTLSVTVTDQGGSTTITATVPNTLVPMEYIAGGKGVSFGKPAELEGVMDIGFQTRFQGGIMHPYLEPATDLDDIRTPNTYIGANVSTYNYGHCPLTSGTFSLEVIGMGDAGQVKQRLTYCHKTNARAWERIYYAGGWDYDEENDPDGGWVCVSDLNGQLLWSGALYMNDIQTAMLSEPVSKQKNGIVLVFSYYDNTEKVALDQEIFEFFIPKYSINEMTGKGRNFNLCGMFRNGVKYLYLHDDRITGVAKNGQSLTIGGIAYDNTGYVLRYVIGV